MLIVLTNYTTGVYASNLIVHDIFSKSIKNISMVFLIILEKNIISQDIIKIKDDFPIYSHLMLMKRKNCSRFSSQNLCNSCFSLDQDAQHTTENNTSPYTPPNAQDWLQRRTSQ